jgi:hypothetical protein
MSKNMKPSVKKAYEIGRKLAEGHLQTKSAAWWEYAPGISSIGHNLGGGSAGGQYGLGKVPGLSWMQHMFTGGQKPRVPGGRLGQQAGGAQKPGGKSPWSPEEQRDFARLGGEPGWAGMERQRSINDAMTGMRMRAAAQRERMRNMQEVFG